MPPRLAPGHHVLLRDFEAGLRDAARLEPRFCPVCALLVPSSLPEGSPELVAVQSQNHELWDECMRNLVAARSPEEETVLQMRLQRNIDTCDHRARAKHERLLRSWQLGHITNALTLFRAVLCLCLTGCMYGLDPSTGLSGSTVLSRASNPRKRFRSSTGSWPTTPDQLFPYGPRQTLVALVEGCLSDEDDGYWWVLNAVMQLARPRVWPVLLADEDLHTMLCCACVLVVSHGTDFRPVMGPHRNGTVVAGRGPHRNVSWLVSGRGLGIVSSFLETIRAGPYARPDDIYQFLCPHTSVFRDAHALASRRFLSNPSNSDWRAVMICLAPTSAHVHEAQTLVPDSQVFAAVEENPRSGAAVTVIQLALRALYSDRHCAGPACTRTALDDETDKPPLPTCARCKLARYCARACQRSDWAGGHRRICRVLSALQDVAPATADVRAYAAQVRSSTIADADLALVARWAAAGSQHYRDIIRTDIVYPTMFDVTRQREGPTPTPLDPDAAERFISLYR
ncbi:hypothetical protein AURDEDRAFT_160894 [Auricularia subglabra TFB-10046 SS5]|nr:hypothetical protein AURDEDRAFT_160894 [Auricularia subglabra TFB-10046 SS5]